MKVSATYSFFKHPIKWLKEWRLRRFIKRYLTLKYKELHPELIKAQMDMFLYGGAVMKGEKHVPFAEFVKKTSS